MKPSLTEKSFRQFIAEISDQHHPMTETVIAASAAQATALAEACMQISLDNQVDTLDWHDVTARIEQMAHIKNTLLEWCNQEIKPATGYLAAESNPDSDNPQELCDYSAEISRYSVEAAVLLQEFRPLVFEPIRNDLEMAIRLLTGTAQTAVLLLDSNLLGQPDESLIQEYEPLRAELQEQLNRLKPVERIGRHGSL